MSTALTPKRGEIWLVEFDRSLGAEMRKVRPAVVLNMDGIGRLPLRVVVPLTDWKPTYQGYAWFVSIPATAANGLNKDSGAPPDATAEKRQKASFGNHSPALRNQSFQLSVCRNEILRSLRAGFRRPYNQ